MNILGASILFAKGTHLHNQLKVLCAHGFDPMYSKLRREIESIYQQENTKANRDALQKFIDKHALDIHNLYISVSSDEENMLSDGESYSLK